MFNFTFYLCLTYASTRLTQAKVVSFDLTDKYLIAKLSLWETNNLNCDAQVLSIDLSDKYLIGMNQCITKFKLDTFDTRKIYIQSLLIYQR